MSRRRSFRTRVEHQELIFEACSTTPALIDSKLPKSKCNEIWEDLTIQLNSLGYGQKSSDKWQRVLQDWLSKMKQKYRNVIQMKSLGKVSTGSTFINPLERKMLELYGFDCTLLDDINVSNIKTKSSEKNEILQHILHMDEASSNLNRIKEEQHSVEDPILSEVEQNEIQEVPVNEAILMELKTVNHKLTEISSVLRLFMEKFDK